MEMEGTKPEEKITHWQNVVGPVFESIWPLEPETIIPWQERSTMNQHSNRTNQMGLITPGHDP